MSRSHLNVVECGTIKERSSGWGLSIPSTIVSDITMGSTQAKIGRASCRERV